jgi:hypothetical protein
MGKIYVKPRKRPITKAIIPAENVETIISPIKVPVKKRSAKKGIKVISKGSEFYNSNKSQEAGP